MPSVVLAVGLQLMVCLAPAAARAQPDAASLQAEIELGMREVATGRVGAGTARLVALVGKIDPTEEKATYYRAAGILLDILEATERYAVENTLVEKLLVDRLSENDPEYLMTQQLYAGRNLINIGRIDDGIAILRAVTGNEQRLVIAQPQRMAAISLSKAALAQGNIEEAALWMRKAVIATLADKAAPKAEIAAVLIELASHLSATRRPQAPRLFAKIAPQLATLLPTNPIALRFDSELVASMMRSGRISGADRLLSALKQAAQSVDVVPPSVAATLHYQELFKLARAGTPEARRELRERIENELAARPGTGLSLDQRVSYAFLLLLGGHVEFAAKILADSREPATYDQLASYRTFLASAIAGEQGDYAKAISLAAEGLRRARAYLHGFAAISADWSPALLSEEQLILGMILQANAAHAMTDEDRNTIFQLSQFINRDKAKLGLDGRINRQLVAFELQREDLRTRADCWIFATVCWKTLPSSC